MAVVVLILRRPIEKRSKLWPHMYIVVLFQGVALLPFVDEKRLLGALSGVYPDLTEFESKFDLSLLT